jgi:hypothetical protein
MEKQFGFAFTTQMDSSGQIPDGKSVDQLLLAPLRRLLLLFHPLLLSSQSAHLIIYVAGHSTTLHKHFLCYLLSVPFLIYFLTGGARCEPVHGEAIIFGSLGPELQLLWPVTNMCCGALGVVVCYCCYCCWSWW